MISLILQRSVYISTAMLLICLYPFRLYAQVAPTDPKNTVLTTDDQQLPPDFNFFSLVPMDTANLYVAAVKQINSLENYLSKKLTVNQKDMLLQAQATYYTFVGNQRKAMEYTAMRQVVKTVLLKDSSQYSTTNAYDYILQQAAQQKTIFFNESHVDVRTRAFLASLLPALKKLGYTQLAMEALEVNQITYPTTTCGFYTCEPNYGNLLRTALDNQFKLITYEDTTAFSSTWNQRDSTQAANLLQQLKTINDTGKLVVLAGHSHIIKHSTKPDFIPMAIYFNRMSGIDPYCIDVDAANLVTYTDIDNTQPYILLKNNTPVNAHPLLYNLQVHYPEVLTVANSQSVNLKNYNITPPDSSLLLIYDVTEYKKAGNINKLVPVYSYYPGNTYMHLLLPKKEYLVYLFNNAGKLLHQQKITVK